MPNYELPPDVSDEEILRVVVRERFSEDLGTSQCISSDSGV